MDETQDIITENMPDTSEMQDTTGGNQNTENEEQGTTNEQDTPPTNTEDGEHQSTDTNGGDTQDIPADGGNEQSADPEISAGSSEEQESTEDNSNSSNDENDEEAQSDVNTGGNEEPGAVTGDGNDSGNESSAGEGGSDIGDNEDPPPVSDDESHAGDDVPNGETQDSTNTDDSGEHGTTEDDGGNSDGDNEWQGTTPSENNENGSEGEEEGGTNDDDNGNTGDDNENSGETQGDTENIDDSEPQKLELLYQSFQYVGEDELRHFLRLSNELYDKKYLPIDGTAKNAESADKLSYSVLINGQPFDGTQDITFEEYAKKEDVLFKTDCADAGEIYNGGKVVTLNDESKIESRFINANSVVEMATDPILHLGTGLIERVADSSKDFDQVISDEAGTSIASNSIYMKQIEVDAPKDKLPLIVSAGKNSFNDYCMPPIEVLKDESGIRTGFLNYSKLDYDFGGAEITLSDSSISFSTKEFPLATNKDFHSDVVITRNNSMEYEDAWTRLTPVEVNGEVTYKFYTNPITPEVLADKTFALNLYYPSSEFCYGVLIENDLYYNNGGILEKGATLNGENDDLTILLTLRQGVNNVPVTREMIMNENVPKDKDLTIVLIAEEDEVLTPFDMSYSIISGSSKCIATPGKHFDELNVDSIKGFSAQYNCDENSYVTFGVLLSTDDNQQSYVIWDSENQSWKESSIEEATAITEVTVTEESPATEESEAEEPENEESVIDEPITELVPVWPVVEKLESVPSEAWNFEGKHFSLVYVLMPDNANSECSIHETKMTYKSKPVYKKAIHGIDYDYAYDGDDVVIAFNTSGRFLVNYPTKTA